MKSLLPLLLGAAPVLSFVIPDRETQSQVFLGGADAHDDTSPLVKAVKALGDGFEQSLKELVREFDDDALTAPGKTPDKKSKAAAAESDYAPWEYFDGEAWLSHHTEAPEYIFCSECYATEDDGTGFEAEGWDGFGITKQGQRWRRKHGGARDDTDPRDGTDPGDGPPYHRDPKREPPHHTPSPPRGIPIPRKPKMPPRDHDPSHRQHTILDILGSSQHTQELYDLIKNDDELKRMLSDTSRNLTVFAPSNRAFEMLRRKQGGGGGDVPRDLVRRIVTYHLAEGLHDSEDLRSHNTLMTRLREDELGAGMHQRLRMGVSAAGPTVNYYARVVMSDIYARNGVIHGVDAVLLPPPRIVDLVQLLPTEFSTSAGALAMSGLLKEFPKLRGRGLTVFLPSNRDWQKLGFAANAFLFAPSHRAYLRAIMKYHLVPDHTLYSDAHVVPNETRARDERDDPSGLTHGYQHAYLPTMLGADQGPGRERYISIDINRLERFLSFRANGLNSIIISDGITKSGVVQVPDHVLLPPHSLHEHMDPPNFGAKGSQYYFGGEVEVEELKSLLEPFVEHEEAELAKIAAEKAVDGGEL